MLAEATHPRTIVKQSLPFHVYVQGFHRSVSSSASTSGVGIKFDKFGFVRQAARFDTPSLRDSRDRFPNPGQTAPRDRPPDQFDRATPHTLASSSMRFDAGKHQRHVEHRSCVNPSPNAIVGTSSRSHNASASGCIRDNQCRRRVGLLDDGFADQINVNGFAAMSGHTISPVRDWGGLPRSGEIPMVGPMSLSQGSRRGIRPASCTMLRKPIATSRRWVCRSR